MRFMNGLQSLYLERFHTNSRSHAHAFIKHKVLQSTGSIVPLVVGRFQPDLEQRSHRLKKMTLTQ